MNVWHILTSEYPPDVGGVSDYTRQVAEGLADAGDEVHVWCPRSSEAVRPRLYVHAALGSMGPRDLWRLGQALRAFEAPRRVLVQWVPHGFGYHSMNVWFCVWLASRALRGDRVELMVHEPYLEFGLGPVKYTVMAFVHRVMTMILLAASRRVWMSIPAWEGRLRPYALRRSLPMKWLPVPGCVMRSEVDAIFQRRKYAIDGQCLVGHFGTYGKDVSALLEARLPAILDDASQPALLLIGAGSERFRHALLALNLRWASRVHATDYVVPDDLGALVALCDVFVQPYPDGISSRRTSAMTCLAGGRAVVTTSGHLTEPLWAASDAVLIVDVHDPEAFVAAALHLIADASARRRVAEHGKRLYAEHFSVDRTVSALRAA